MSAQLLELPSSALRHSTVEDLLVEARRDLHRLPPHPAAAAVAAGALLVDIRPHAQRVAEGEVPGALVLERNVLEWRLDPASPHRVPEAGRGRLHVVLCSEGYASSFAAATLRGLGLDATDVDGGFVAWRASGLPTAAGGTPAGRRSGWQPPVLEIDLHRSEVHVHGQRLDLPVAHLRLLLALAAADGRVLSRTQTARAAGIDPDSPRGVDVVVHRLRRRLGAVAAQRLVTVRGRGYRLVGS